MQPNSVPSTRLAREVLKLHLTPFAWTIGSLSAIMLLKATASHWATVTAADGPRALLSALILPLAYILPITLPLAVLTATLYAPIRLGTIEPNASTPPFGSVARPVLACATALALFSLLWQNAILPQANRRLRTLYAAAGLPASGSVLHDREMSIGDLQAAAARAKSAAAADIAQRPTLLRQAAAFDVELHKKFAMASACLVLGALGLVLGRLTGGGYLLAIGAGAFVFMAYYVCLIAGEALGDRGTLSPAAAMWSPDILVVLATLLGLWQLSAQQHRDLPAIH